MKEKTKKVLFCAIGVAGCGAAFGVGLMLGKKKGYNEAIKELLPDANVILDVDSDLHKIFSEGAKAATKETSPRMDTGSYEWDFFEDELRDKIREWHGCTAEDVAHSKLMNLKIIQKAIDAYSDGKIVFFNGKR